MITRGLSKKMQRKTFASIAQQEHPDTSLYQFDFSDTYVESYNDEGITSFLFESIYGISKPTGEWAWLHKHKQKNFLNSLIAKNVEETTRYLSNLFKSEASYGYVSPSYSDSLKDVLRVSSDILTNIDTCFEFSDLKLMSSLATEQCNPFGLYTKTGKILPDTPRHFYYSSNIARLVNDNDNDPTILEIGGGYGGLCLQNYKRFNGRCTLINIDLLPALFAAAFYLLKNDVPVNILSSTNPEIKPGEVNLLLAEDNNLLSRLLHRCDVIFNSRSLCEMGQTSIQEYFNFINTVDVRYFYHENSNYLLYPDSKRHIEVVASSFPVSADRFTLMANYISPFSGGSGRYREFIYRSVNQ